MSRDAKPRNKIPQRMKQLEKIPVIRVVLAYTAKILAFFGSYQVTQSSSYYEATYTSSLK